MIKCSLRPNINYCIIELHIKPPHSIYEWLGNNCKSSWFIQSKKIYFENEKDLLMFLLRWV